MSDPPKRQGEVWLPPPTQLTENECSRSFSAVVGFPWSLLPRQPTSRPPQPPKMSTNVRFRQLWVFSGCHHHHGSRQLINHPTSSEIEHSCSFSAVVGFLCCCHHDNPSTSPHNCQNRAFTLVLGFLGCRHTTTHQPAHNCQNRVFALVFSGCGLSLPAATTANYRPSPQPPKSNVCTRFWQLWTVFACLHYDQPSTTPTTAEIEHLRSFSAVVGFLSHRMYPKYPPRRQVEHGLILLFNGTYLVFRCCKCSMKI